MKSIDVFCHLMPPEYAKICMAEAPNKSHMFVRALNVASMSNMDARNEVLKPLPGRTNPPVWQPSATTRSKKSLRPTPNFTKALLPASRSTM